MAIEAALEAERMHREREAERRRIVELDLQQAEYEASLAERRYWIVSDIRFPFGSAGAILWR